MTARPQLSLVFPVFDEEANLGPLFDRALALAPRLARDFEIVVVDDGSRDGSLAVIEARRRAEPRIRVVRHAANQGYGAALRAGLHAARGDLVFFSDADLQFDLEELTKLLAHTFEFDLVAGYREPRRDPFLRIALAATWGALVRGLFGLRVRDIDCAFKVFHRRVLEAIPIASVGACVNTEILLRAEQAGFRIHQVAVSHRRRRAGRQSGARPRVILRALVELAGLYAELRRAGSSTSLGSASLRGQASSTSLGSASLRGQASSTSLGSASLRGGLAAAAAGAAGAALQTPSRRVL